MIEIYGKFFCSYCDQAKALCEARGVPYTYKELDKDFTKEQLLEIFPNAKTFPQVKIDNTNIGGFAELKEHLDKQ